MTNVDPDERARQLAGEALRSDDPTGWFERLYAAAAQGEAAVPWDRRGPHPLLADWAERSGPSGDAKRALVVGGGARDLPAPMPLADCNVRTGVKWAAARSQRSGT